MRERQSECKDCTTRHEGCHSTCEKYIKWKEAHQQKKDEIQKKKYDEMQQRIRKMKQ